MRTQRLGTAAITALAAISALTLTAGAQCDPARVPTVGPQTTAHSLAIYDGELFAGTAVTPSRVYQWNGLEWLAVRNTRPVHAMAVYRDELVAAGSDRWDGTSWRELDDDEPNNTVFAMTVVNGELVMGGSLTRVGSRSFNRVVRWNGSDWLPMGDGLNGEVRTLAVYNDEVVAGGLFTSSGGRPVNHVARWDGSQWQQIGSGVDGVVDHLIVYNGDLIAGGIFFTAGGSVVNHIARWDGSAWRPLGVGVTPVGPVPAIMAMTVYRDQLIAGGFMETAGGIPVNRIARWDGSSWHAMDSHPGLSTFHAMVVHDHQIVAGCGVGISLARWACPHCIADVDDDGEVDFTDYLAFLDLYRTNAPGADLTGDGFVDRSDWLLFFETYSAGCP